MKYVVVFALIAILTAGCGITGPDQIELLTRASFSFVSGDFQTDTVEARLTDPLTAALVSENSEPIAGVMINFVVLEEDCGRPFAGSAITDSEGLASERWDLGTVARLCSMEARAVDSDGTPRVYATASATVTPGKAIGGFIDPASARLATGTLDLSGETLEDRYANLITDWSFTDPKGPFHLEGTKTLIADSVGLGTVDLRSGVDLLANLDLRICEGMAMLLWWPVLPHSPVPERCQ